MRAGHGAAGGFTLVEVVVAFLIAALSVTVVFQIVGRAATSAGLSEDYQQATLIAESILSDPAPDAPEHGTTGKFAWHQLRTSAVDIMEAERKDSGFGRDVLLEDVGVTVNWWRNGREHAFNLRTQRLVSLLDTVAP